MLEGPKELWIYETANGKSPFTQWIDGLDDVGRACVWIHLDRLEHGNHGHVESIGGGVHELKIDRGPGYRVYFGQEGAAQVVLLCGGDKKAQARDVRKATEYLKDYEGRK